MARKYPDLIDDLAIIQGEDYLELVDSAVIKLTGDLSQGTPSGQIRTDYLEDSGTLLANFAFESSVYDGATDETTIKPYLTNIQTSSLAKTSFKTGKTPSLRNCYVYDIEVELNNVKHKLAYGFVQVIGEVTGNGTPAPSPVEVFLTASNNLSELTDPAAARANLEIVAGAKSDWNAAPGSDEEILNKPTLGTAAATNITDYATAAQGALADTALQPADVGVTVQGYSADTVIDANYVATENSYTTTEKNKLAGIEAGATADQTGTEIKTLYEAEADTNAYTDAEKTKLSGIATGATANNTDANLLNRANHTGTQLVSTISDFDTEVSNNSSVVANTAKVSADGSIATHSDVDLTGIGINQVLKWDGSKFVPSVDDDDFVGVTNLSYTASETGGTIVSDTGQDATIIAGSTIYASLMLPGDKTKLDGIATGAEVNVQSDWNATSGDAHILNKPTVYTTTNSATPPAGAIEGDTWWDSETGEKFIYYNDGDTLQWVQVSNTNNLVLADVGTAAYADVGDFISSADSGNYVQTTGNQSIAGTKTFTTALILPNNSRINGVEHFYQTSKPTVRGDSSALVAGDRWWKTDDGTEWFWNGTYWLSNYKGFYSMLDSANGGRTGTISVSTYLAVGESSVSQTRQAMFPFGISSLLLTDFSFSVFGTTTLSESNYISLHLLGSNNTVYSPNFLINSNYHYYQFASVIPIGTLGWMVLRFWSPSAGTVTYTTARTTVSIGYHLIFE